MPKVSIILPVYNGELSIGRTIDSLLNQSLSDFELCICIDGSKDDSEKIIRGFSDQRIRLFINDTNMGLGRTLNKLVAATHQHAEYIAMAEQDDFYYPDRLKLQVDFLEKHKDTGMVSGIAEHHNGEEVTFSFPGLLVHNQNYPANLQENFLLNYCYQVKVVNSCMMFRKSVFLENGLYFSMHYPSISVDWAFILRFSLCSRIQGISVPLVQLDRRPNRKSLTNKKKLQFATARELINNFRFEYSEIISSRHYRTALTTEHLIELAHTGLFKRVIFFPIFFFKNPTDPRWIPFIKKSFLRIKT